MKDDLDRALEQLAEKSGLAKNRPPITEGHPPMSVHDYLHKFARQMIETAMQPTDELRERVAYGNLALAAILWQEEQSDRSPDLPIIMRTAIFEEAIQMPDVHGAVMPPRIFEDAESVADKVTRSLPNLPTETTPVELLRLLDEGAIHYGFETTSSN
ncbi:MAG TPA: hypothetical protein VLF87_03965 [Patescibacteria group bacterium]|nr:hypothetical protein [Patescibacteria group bacterium]